MKKINDKCGNHNPISETKTEEVVIVKVTVGDWN